jgi:hypothetical protein
MCVVNNVLKNKHTKTKREDLLEETNSILKQNGLKKISFGSLKRYLSELKNMSENDKIKMYENMDNIKKERQQDLLDALESSDKNSKKVNICKKRLKQVEIK